MTTITINGFVHCKRSDFSGKDDYTFFTFDATGSSMGYSMVGPAEFAYELPAGFSPTAARLQQLAAEREKAGKDFADAVRRIDAEIGKLTAISNEVPA